MLDWFLRASRDKQSNPRLVEFLCAISNQLLQQVRSHLMRGANYPGGHHKDVLGCTRYPVPPVQEQRRIIARIKECMERVQEIQGLSAQAIGEASSVLRAFYKDLYTELLNTYPNFPLGEAGRIWGGGTPSKSNPAFWGGDIPWVSPKEMKRRDINLSAATVTQEAVTNSSTKLIEHPSVMFVVRGMILAHTLPVAVNRVPVTMNQDMKAITPRNGLSVDFLAAMVRGAERGLLAKIEVAGHGTRRLQTSIWSATPIPDLTPEAQADVVEHVRDMESLADQLVDQVNNNEVGSLRESILRKAFAGEL